MFKYDIWTYFNQDEMILHSLYINVYVNLQGGFKTHFNKETWRTFAAKSVIMEYCHSLCWNFKKKNIAVEKEIQMFFIVLFCILADLRFGKSVPGHCLVCFEQGFSKTLGEIGGQPPPLWICHCCIKCY